MLRLRPQSGRPKDDAGVGATGRDVAWLRRKAGARIEGEGDDAPLSDENEMAIMYGGACNRPQMGNGDAMQPNRKACARQATGVHSPREAGLAGAVAGSSPGDGVDAIACGIDDQCFDTLRSYDAEVCGAAEEGAAGGINGKDAEDAGPLRHEEKAA